MELSKLVRPNILKLKPYSSARDEFKGEASVYLDANENPLNAPYNRYPDPLQRALKQIVAQQKGVETDQLFFGNGSDEPIDLVFRIFCEPGVDNVVAIDPTYGMYEVSAEINNVSYRKVGLRSDFSLDAQALLDAVDANTKVIFLCSPNNPTGNALDPNAIRMILNVFPGIVVLDEAYIDFSAQPGFLSQLNDFPRLIILQTFSKAWGLAAVRLGMAFAQVDIIRLFNKVKYPYNINVLTQEFVANELKNPNRTREWVAYLLEQRNHLTNGLKKLPLVKYIHPTDANFVLVHVEQATEVYKKLVDQGVIVRNRSHIHLCMDCLRITVGTQEENDALLDALKNL